MDEMTQHDEARIRQRAYEIWMDEGAPSGRSDANWAQAEAELARTDGLMDNQTVSSEAARPAPTRRKSAR